MNTSLILFGVQSVLRLGNATRQALEQSARDQEVIFPALKTATFSTERFVNGYFNTPGNRQYVSGSIARYAEYWDGDAVKIDPTCIDALYTAAVNIEASRGKDVGRFHTGAAAVLVMQWDPSKGPVSPWARVILTAGDIALDYIGTNPGIVGGGSGAKLISAYAKSLAALLPDNGEFGNREDFAQRVFGVFLRAGLTTLTDYPEWVVSEDHLQELIKSTVTPVVEAFPASLADQLRWREVSDAIMGPAASALLNTVAKHPEAFLGSDFSTDKAAGALTQALLKQAAETGLGQQFSREGMVALYSTALGVLAERPQLFLGTDDRPQNELARDLLAGFANVLKESPPPFDGDVGLQLAEAALVSVSENLHGFIGTDNPWESVAADMVKSFVDSMSGALRDRQSLHSVFSKTQLVDLGRVLLTHLANSPSMVGGSDNESLQAVLVAVTNAMKADDDLLLNGDEWIQIAAVAAAEAAANPARLFKLDPANPGEVLAGQVMAMVIKSALAARQADAEKSVLFGSSLSQAIMLVLEATSGRPQDIADHLAAFDALLEDLNGFVTANSGQFGGDEWQELLARLLPMVLAGEKLPDFTVEVMTGILRGTE
jgi:hypothetical protein